MSNAAVYENDNYAVAIDRARTILIEGNEFKGGYMVYNKETGIEEFFTLCLPEALRIAVHWDIAISHENHLWPYKRGSEQMESPHSELLQ